MRHAALTGIAAFACACSSQAQSENAIANERAQVIGRLDAATQMVSQFRPEIPDNVANRAECVLAMPGVKKGGLVVGGQGGKGFATCYRGGAWSDPAPIKIGGGTLGAQLGYESVDILSLITSDRAVAALDSGNFKVGVNASAAAGPVGAGRSASGDVTVTSDVLSYSSASGLFAGATLDGMTISADDDATRALYGSNVSTGDILERRATLPADAAVKRFRAAVQSAFVPSAIGLALPSPRSSPRSPATE